MLLTILTLSLEKESIVLVKVWKKSLILQPKICTNPDCVSLPAELPPIHQPRLCRKKI